jgi:hypothetical protein
MIKRKNILAENMLRFGVKNLTESQVKYIKLIMEQAGGIPPELPQIMGLDLLKGDDLTAPIYNYFATAIKNYGIKFSIGIGDPAAYMTVGYIANAAFRGDNVIKRAAKTSITRVIRQSRGQRGAGAPAERIQVPSIASTNILQLNFAPSNPTGGTYILTVGKVTAKAGPDVNNAGRVSAYSEVQKWMNDYNLKTYLTSGTTTLVDKSFFKEGDPKKGGGAGSLDLVNNPFGTGNNRGMVFYGFKDFEPQSGQTTATTNTTTTFTPGEEISPQLGELFATGKITLAPDKAEAISAAVKDAQKLGKIEKMRIESSASADRPTNISRAAFANMVGLPVDQVPLNPSVNNKSNNVTDPMEGGNAFLAINRGQVAADAVKAVAGVPPTIEMKAKIQDGEDDAQYVKIFITVQKPDNTTTITQDDLTNIGTAAQSTGVAGKAQMVVIVLN